MQSEAHGCSSMNRKDINITDNNGPLVKISDIVKLRNSIIEYHIISNSRLYAGTTSICKHRHN